MRQEYTMNIQKWNIVPTVPRPYMDRVNDVRHRWPM